MKLGSAMDDGHWGHLTLYPTARSTLFLESAKRTGFKSAASRSKLEKGERRRAITDAWSTRDRRTSFQIKTLFEPPIKSWPRYTEC
ncbi:hypothetical protein Ccrd_004240 [Cynara cardunculus var. scolymus]|uniref:Uncharacterized protein n=1 Tax=Cynara cardunculus var. scolymus TaxID=59895 RepID=A0A103XMU0_CYNCS|nr:hypothetical protein Ccrd_004240 [Cynara cardunculus var. scolymus]